MSTHFDGKYEAEFKYRLTDPQAFRAQLAAAGAEPFVTDNDETDWFYDHPDNALAGRHISMSVRAMSPSGIRLWIVKGPAAQECQAINISDTGYVRQMLTTLGYRHTMTLKKTRSVWFLGEIHITFDHLTDLGWFAEFAVMTHDESRLPDYERQLKALAATFGLTDAMIETQSYKTLMRNNGIAG